MWHDVHEEVDKLLIQDAIGEVLNSLRDRHRSVLICRFWYGMTLKETGEKFGVTQEVIRQNEAKALRILRGEKYKKEFLKLGIPWIDNIATKELREKEKERIEGLKLQKEWERKQLEQKIEAQKLANARQKLKIVDSKIPKPEMKLVYIPRPPDNPPFFVKLLYNAKNQPFLYVDSAYGSIDRNRDPHTYDKWLKYLILHQQRNINGKNNSL